MEGDIKRDKQKYDEPNGSDQDLLNEASPRRRKRDGGKRAEVGLSPESNEKSTIESKLKKKKKKDNNMACSRFIAFLMISPTVIYFFSVLYEIISRYTLSGQLFHIGALVLGFVIAGALCTVLYRPLKPFFKYIAIFSLCVFFLPTMQVFNCSPLPLDNSKLGTMLRLNEEAGKFLKIAYQNSSCWKNLYFKAPFELSAYSPRLRIFVKPYQIINLGMQHFDEKDDAQDGPPPEILPFTLYLLTSPRSVKRQMYYVNLLIMVAGKARGIADVLELGVDDRENVTLHLTGSLKKMGAEFNETRLELEQMQYLIRPLVFHINEIEVSGMPDKDEEDDNKEKKKNKKERQKKSDEFYEDDSQYHD